MTLRIRVASVGGPLSSWSHGADNPKSKAVCGRSPSASPSEDNSAAFQTAFVKAATAFCRPAGFGRSLQQLLSVLDPEVHRKRRQHAEMKRGLPFIGGYRSIRIQWWLAKLASDIRSLRCNLGRFHTSFPCRGLAIFQLHCNVATHYSAWGVVPFLRSDHSARMTAEVSGVPKLSAYRIR